MFFPLALYFCVCLFFPILVGFYFIILDVILFSNEKEKERERRCVWILVSGEMSKHGRVGGGKTMIRIYCIKISIQSK